MFMVHHQISLIFAGFGSQLGVTTKLASGFMNPKEATVVAINTGFSQSK